MISLEVLYAALLFFLLLKPQFVKKPLWFKFAVILFAARLALVLVWFWFTVWGHIGLTRVIGTISGAVNSGLFGLSIICLLVGQAGSITALQQEAKAEKAVPKK